MSRTTEPTCRWPQGCSMRHRVTKSGAKFCAALKKAVPPVHRLLMLVAALVVVRTAPLNVAVVNADCVRALQLFADGTPLVSVWKAPNGPAKSASGFSAATAIDMP